MSQQLMDYISAHHEAIASILELLAAEHRLSDENSSVLALGDAELKVDAAARALAAAVGALPGRQPAGWSKPSAASGGVQVARQRLVTAGLRCLSSIHADESADADATSEYADEMLALAARNLVAKLDPQTTDDAAGQGRLL